MREQIFKQLFLHKIYYYLLEVMFHAQNKQELKKGTVSVKRTRVNTSLSCSKLNVD